MQIQLAWTPRSSIKWGPGLRVNSHLLLNLKELEVIFFKHRREDMAFSLSSQVIQVLRK